MAMGVRLLTQLCVLLLAKATTVDTEEFAADLFQT